MVIDDNKLSKLKGEIREKEIQLFNEIAEAQGTGDDKSYIALKQLQMQCNAQLRLIEHIEKGFKSKSDYIIC